MVYIALSCVSAVVLRSVLSSNNKADGDFFYCYNAQKNHNALVSSTRMVCDTIEFFLEIDEACDCANIFFQLGKCCVCAIVDCPPLKMQIINFKNSETRSSS